MLLLDWNKQDRKFNNGLCIIYGYVASIANNTAITVTLPITVHNWMHYYVSVVWNGSYSNHAAGFWVSNSQLGIQNYRSYAETNKAIGVMYCIFA